MTDLMLIAHVGAQTIAIDAKQVEGVVDIASVVPVPFAAPHILGLAAIRSQVLTVIDCSCALGHSPSAATGRALVMIVDGHRYALRVDAVEDVVAAEIAYITTLAPMAPAWARAAIGCVDLGDRFAVLVDPAQLIVPFQAIAA